MAGGDVECPTEGCGIKDTVWRDIEKDATRMRFSQSTALALFILDIRNCCFPCDGVRWRTFSRSIT